MNGKSSINNFDISEEIILRRTEDVDFEKAAFDEEVVNAENIYRNLGEEIDNAVRNIPYPEVGRYEVGTDYYEIEKLQYKKSENSRYWEIIEETQTYFDSGCLYEGHLCYNNRNYFLMENGLKTRSLNAVDAMLISMDDAKFQSIFRKWKFPRKEDEISFSRNVEMQNKHISSVQIIYDKDNELYSDISDLFLRNALIKNKSKTNIQSIIRTIQEKQDRIRSYPANTSFIVQGCAGSGKTMVLLHRLRYLIYNNFINHSSYTLLVPSRNFREFIAKSSHIFNIRKESIFSLTDYYKFLLNYKLADDVKDESVFPEEFLNEVYSKGFIKKCYAKFYSHIEASLKVLINYCELGFSELFIKEKNNFAELNRNDLKTAEAYLKSISDKLESYGIKNSATSTIADFEVIISKLNKIIVLYKLKLDGNKRLIEEFELDDGTLQYHVNQNTYIQKLISDIKYEERRVSDAPVFTRQAHKYKLDKLLKEYSQVVAELKSKITAIEKEKTTSKLIDENRAYEAEINKLSDIVNDLRKNIDIVIHAQKNLENIDSVIEDEFNRKYNNEIAELVKLIGSFTGSDNEQSVVNLTPIKLSLLESITLGNKLYAFIKSACADTDIDKNKFNIFSPKSEKEPKAYLYLMMLNIAKSILKEKFGVTVNKNYKHYWFLVLYFNYLVKGNVFIRSNYIFIDEAQDLSIAEIELINKVNGDVIFNLFGDVQQTVNNYGITEWKSISFINKMFYLNENFRNSDQIVEYCNANLPVAMQAIGVRTDDVNILDKIEDLSTLDECVFIAKNEYAKLDLLSALKNRSNLNYKIYSIKEVKGLEFKEICVFDAGMTENEKYIAYTRALIKLNIVKILPEAKERTELIIQSDDEEDYYIS